MVTGINEGRRRARNAPPQMRLSSRRTCSAEFDLSKSSHQQREARRENEGTHLSTAMFCKLTLPLLFLGPSSRFLPLMTISYCSLALDHSFLAS